jgi:hypothetical protein
MTPSTLKAIAAAGVVAATASHATETAVMSPVPWDTNGRFLQELQVPDEAAVEVCEKLSTGAQVSWRYKASTPVDFNVHFHQGKEVSTPVRIDHRAQADAVFKATSAQEYCWTWLNRSGKPVRLAIQLQKR